MAWGIFNKIGKGLKKAAEWVGHEVGNVARAVAPVVHTLAPGIEAAFPEAAGAVAAIDTVLQGLVGANGHGIRRSVYQS